MCSIYCIVKMSFGCRRDLTIFKLRTEISLFHRTQKSFILFPSTSRGISGTAFGKTIYGKSTIRNLSFAILSITGRRIIPPNTDSWLRNNIETASMLIVFVHIFHILKINCFNPSKTKEIRKRRCESSGVCYIIVNMLDI